jgi:pimeloyl-ACP methyl ester carboxylesterase
MALVHGSWGDATHWDAVTPALARSFRTLSYDRRGHSRSERPGSQGSVDEDGDDLAALLESLDLVPAHVVANSYGGNIALRLATRRPELFRSLSCHEPPVWSLLDDDAETRAVLERAARSVAVIRRRVAERDHEGAAREFVDRIAFAPGVWSLLPAQARAICVRNAPTFIDEVDDPDHTWIDPGDLARLEMPLRVTDGSESPAHFRRIVERLAELIPGAERETFAGAAHAPQMTDPRAYVRTTAVTPGPRSGGRRPAAAPSPPPSARGG